MNALRVLALALAAFAGTLQAKPDEDASLRAAFAKAYAASAKLRAPRTSDGSRSDQFGEALAFSGNTAIIGSDGDTLVDDKTAQGSAYVFVRDGAGAWSLQQKLVASDADFTHRFGGAVAIDGDTAVVGAIGAGAGQSGAIYVFVRSGGTWTQQQRIVPATIRASDAFGTTVAVSGNTLMAGAPTRTINGNTSQGALFAYVRNGTTWSQQAEILTPGAGMFDRLGDSLALDGDTAVAGNSRQEAAHVFVRSGSTWTRTQRLTASDAAGQQDSFGSDVAIDGDTVFVTAISRGGGRGAVYAFARGGGGAFVEQGILQASDGVAQDLFGAAMQIDGDRAAIGAPDTAPKNGFAGQGTAYVFERSGSAWLERQKLRVASGVAGDRFGVAIGVQGGVVIGGASLDDVGANIDQGAVIPFVHGGGTTWTEGARIDSGTGGYEAWFGESVAVFDRWAVIGAPTEDTDGGDERGAAYVFARNGASWTLDARLLAPDGAAGDRFGSAVAVSDTHVLVGAPRKDRNALADHGAVYAFVRNGNAWSLQATLLPGAADALDGGVSFGSALAMQDARVLVGAPGARNNGAVNAGAAYVFDRSGTTWPAPQRLAATDAAANDRSGASVALDGDSALLGVPDDDLDTRANAGSALVFARSGGAWGAPVRLVVPNGVAGDTAGTSVALAGDVALLGVPDAVVSNQERGAVQPFFRSGGAWSAGQRFVASDSFQFARFGNALALSRDTAIVGTNFVPEPVYVFVRSGTTFVQTFRFEAADTAFDDRLGTAIAMWRNLALLGASHDDGSGVFGNPDEGSAYVYIDGSPPPVGSLFYDGFE